MSTESTIKALMGLQDARGPRGIAARGKNVYKGTSTAANSKGVGMAKPSQRAIARRLSGDHYGLSERADQAGQTLRNQEANRRYDQRIQSNIDSAARSRGSRGKFRAI